MTATAGAEERPDLCKILIHAVAARSQHGMARDLTS
jgi:hypothetical protein